MATRSSSPAAGSRCKVNRTVDGATFSRRAISLPDIPAAFNRSTSRTWRIAVLSAGIRSPLAKAEGADRKRASRDAVRPPSTRATSSRNRGRVHPESAADHVVPILGAQRLWTERHVGSEAIEPGGLDGHLLNHLGADPELELFEQIAQLIAV